MSLIQLTGYDCISQGKSCSSKGGLLIYIDKRFDYEVKMNLNTYEHWEGQIIQITGGGLSQPVIIGNIYRPPRPSTENYNKFINEFSTVLSTLRCHQNNSVILAGDYNINMLQINEQEHCSTFFDMLTSFSLFPQITLPTRFTTRAGTLIDNFFCNLTKRILQSTAGILIKKFSDHQPYFMFVNTTLKEDHTTKFIQVNVQNKEAMLKVKNELHSSDIYTKLDTNPNTDPNYNYNIIIDEINQAKDKYMTSKLVKFNKYKHKKSTWITQGLLTSIRYRDKLYKQIKLTNPESSKYAILLVNLKTYNSILKTSFRKAKQLYYDKCFNNFKFDIKNTWKTINEIISKNKTNKSFPKYFKDSDSIVRDKSEIVNKFNDFFTNIGSNLASNIKYKGTREHTYYLNKIVDRNFTFSYVEEDIIKRTIINLPNKSSCGYDGLSTKLLKILEPALTKSLTLLINQVLTTGIFPDKLKIAKVIPVYKKGEKTVFSNYRPISLLPAISKILEKNIFEQLSSYLRDSRLLFDHQYGFRPKHSTEYAALELIDRIITQLDKDEIPINIYLDLSKAFDTIDHIILIDKLKYYGVHGTNLNLFSSYLENRKQYTEIDNIKSNMLQITTGVPQGSILGPLLFIIYINDFAQASKMFNFLIYADDTTLSSTLNVFSDKTHDQNFESLINEELVKINDWLKINKLSLNVVKSKFMIFQKKKKNIQILNLKIDNVNIDQVKEFNFLGLIIDTNLNWKKHAEKISNACSKKIGILNKLKHILPLDIKKILYNSLIVPHINYCIMAWGFESNRIIKLQKKALRIITLSNYISHTEPLYKQLSLLKVDDILKLQQLKFYYKYLHNDLPRYLQNWRFVFKCEVHGHDTRYKNKIYTYKIKHEFAKKCLRHNLPLLLNNLPEIVKEKLMSHSTQGFVNYVKLYFLQSYEVICTRQNCYVCMHN